MPITVAFDEELVEYELDGQKMTLELSGKHIRLYHPKAEQAFLCSSVGTLCSVTDLTNKEQMLAAFPDRKSILLSSQLHIKGTTNKDKFRASINKLLALKKITPLQHEGLKLFIADATCPPMKIIEKLVVQGYTDLLTPQEFAEDAPELSLCADILENYIKELT